MQTGEEQGEGLAETWAGAGSWGPLWLQPWPHWGPHGSGGGEGRPKVSDDKLKSVHRQHPHVALLLGDGEVPVRAAGLT